MARHLNLRRREASMEFPWAKLREIWKKEFDGEDALVRSLAERWPALTKVAVDDVRATKNLVARLRKEAPHDPLFELGDTLTIMGRSLHEPTHTRALVAFASPVEGDELRGRALRALLDLVDPGRDWLDADADRMGKVSIEAEKPCAVAKAQRYMDIVISVMGTDSLLVVIENKVRAQDREGQLAAYATWAHAKKGYRHRKLIYLTRNREEPRNAVTRDWRPLGYEDILIAWRKVMSSCPESVWAHAFRHYLATLAHAVLKFDLDDSRRLALLRLKPYLHASLGERS
jgi:hypothetical protein